MRFLIVVATLAYLPGAATSAEPAPGSSPAAVAAVSEAIGAALGADLGQSVGHLARLPAGEFRGRDATFRACMIQRFGARPESGTHVAISDPFPAKALAAYRAYWREALLHPGERGSAEKKLLGELRRTLASDAADMGALEPALRQRLAQSAFHSLQGVTQPLRELMLWKREEERSYRVQLPDGEYTTRVMVLHDFASLGWADHATCGRRGAGGWTTRDALYIVAPRYESLDGEEFRVSFLGHETQHFADLAGFPGMASWELEYRAKLTELALARDTRATILARFREDQGDEQSSPHSYANRRVLAAVKRRLALPETGDLDAVDIATLQAAAAEELRDDTLRRRQNVIPSAPSAAAGPRASSSGSRPRRVRTSRRPDRSRIRGAA